MKSTNWNLEENNLIGYLKAGMTYREIGKIYSLTPSTIREQVIKRNLDIYFQHHNYPKKKLTLNEIIEEKLKWYTSSNFQHTRDYLVAHLREDLEFRTYKGILLREDIIEQYHKSRENSKYKFSYDFSKLPEYVKNRTEKFTVIVNEISPKTHKLVGEWETCFKHLVIQKMDNGVCGGIKGKEFFSLTREEFIERCIEKFGDMYDYSKIVYVNMQTPILIRCNKCGKYFWQVPYTHLDSPGQGCPECVMVEVGRKKYLGIEELSARCDDIYGPIYDFTNSVYSGQKNNITAINKLTGQEITAAVEEFLRGTVEKEKMSSGEKHISNWLETHNIQYSYNSPIVNKVQGRKSKYVRIDFILNYNEREIWIEYNGEQHYRRVEYWVSHDQYLEELNRDRNVREYCIKNNIVFVEIPYTYNTFSRIGEVLGKVILENSSTEFIKIPDIIV